MKRRYRKPEQILKSLRLAQARMALVKRFAEVHRGFVEIAAAKPTGVLFRVGLGQRG